MTPNITKPHNYKENQLLTGTELAKLLDVAGPSLSEAARKGYNCAGYPVHEWAKLYDSGRIKGYDVPNSLLIENDWERKQGQNRNNPEEKNLKEPNQSSSEVKNQKTSEQAVVTNNYSVFPAGQDYTVPIGMATIPFVMKEALANDTPVSRAAIAGGLAIVSAMAAYSMTNSAAAGFFGAAAGAGLALYILNGSPQPVANYDKYIIPELRSQQISSNNQKKIDPVYSEYVDYILG